jgi:hypothetical protein
VGDQNPGLATGVLLVILGVWVVSRTLIHDRQGHNLVDRIVGYSSKASASSTGNLIAQGLIPSAYPVPLPGLTGPLSPLGPAGQTIGPRKTP